MKNLTGTTRTQKANRYKKILATSLFSALVFASATLPAFAAEGGFSANTLPTAGGFQGPGPSIVSVQQARQMRDDAPVALRGSVIQHLGDDDYLFKDATGTIQVEISDKRWMGQTVTPQDTVEIVGEVDKDWNSVEIDVDTIVKK